MTIQSLQAHAIRDAKRTGAKGAGFILTTPACFAGDMFRLWMGKKAVAPHFACGNRIGLTREGALAIKSAYVAAYDSAYAESLAKGQPTTV